MDTGGNTLRQFPLVPAQFPGWGILNVPRATARHLPSCSHSGQIGTPIPCALCTGGMRRRRHSSRLKGPASSRDNHFRPCQDYGFVLSSASQNPPRNHPRQLFSQTPLRSPQAFGINNESRADVWLAERFCATLDARSASGVERANAFNQLRPRSFDSGIEFPKGSFSKNSKLIF
jgi:hypothetical protein